MPVTETAQFAKTLADTRPGTVARGRIMVGSFASGAELSLPYMIVKGASAGPSLWISGQVHGNEINGIWAALDFVGGLDPAQMSGTVIVTPTANPVALDARRKTGPYDEQDLDQTFPGNPNGLISNQLSAALFAAVEPHADVAVSMHTMNNLFDSDPYGVYKVHPESGVSEDDVLTLLRHFDPAFACRMNVSGGTGELPGNIAGALDYQMLAKGKRAFMVELGSGSCTSPSCIAKGVAGLRGVAADLGLIDARTAPPKSLRRVTRRTHVMTTRGGLFRTDKGAATLVRAGQPIGKIYSLLGEDHGAITLGSDVYTIGIRKDPVVHTGDRVAFVALEWDDHKI